MRLFRKNIPWLLVFVGGSKKEEEDVEKFVKMASHHIHASSPPQYVTMRIGTEKTRKFPVGKPVENELSELFSDAVVNDLIREKKKKHAQNVALVIHRNAFPDEDVFIATIEETRYHDSIYRLICNWTDFLASSKRKTCYKNSCAQCRELREKCSHSCFPHLLWLMFDRDDRVLEVFTEETPKS